MTIFTLPAVLCNDESMFCLRLIVAGFLLFSLCMSAARLDDATRQLARDIFQQLIEINTTDSVGNTTIAAEAMAKRLLDTGFPAKDVSVLGPNERKGNLVARLRGSVGNPLKPILIIGHLDVVEALRADWSTDPFKFVEKDGYFYGRGTQDMKVNDAVLITTLIRFKREGYVPKRDIILALTADEEGGTFNGVEWLLKNRRLMIDAEYGLNADAGGVLTERGKPIDVEVEATEKLYADFQLTATNAGGHSSLPVPDNAIYHLANALTRLERTPFPFELNAITRTYFERLSTVESKQKAADMKGILQTPPDQSAIARLSADPHYNSTMRTTCVATRLSAGHANNALPQTAQANVNCRIVPGHSTEEIRQELEKVLADAKISVRELGGLAGVMNRRSFAPPPLRPDVFQPLENVVESMWPGL